MTLAEIRLTPTLVTAFRQDLQSEHWQVLISALDLESPLRKKEQGEPLRLLGRIEGYDLCIQNLLSAATHRPDKKVDNPEITP